MVGLTALLEDPAAGGEGHIVGERHQPLERGDLDRQLFQAPLHLHPVEHLVRGVVGKRQEHPLGAEVADWLADHLGQMALWPLPQYAVHLTEACERGALALNVTEADGRQFGPLSANVHLTYDGVQGWQETESNGRWILIIAADGWQIAQLSDVESDLLWLTEPLARAAAVGSTIMPLVWGKAIDPADLTQWVPGMVGGNIPTQIQPAPLPDQDVLDDPWLDEIPIWPDGNWRDSPRASASAAVQQLDTSLSDAWIRRADPVRNLTLERRYLLTGPDALTTWMLRLWAVQGQFGSLWLPDGIAPVMTVQEDAAIDSGYLVVEGGGAAAFGGSGFSAISASILALSEGGLWWAFLGLN